MSSYQDGYFDYLEKIAARLNSSLNKGIARARNSVAEARKQIAEAEKNNTFNKHEQERIERRKRRLDKIEQAATNRENRLKGNNTYDAAVATNKDEKLYGRTQYAKDYLEQAKANSKDVAKAEKKYRKTDASGLQGEDLANYKAEGENLRQQRAQADANMRDATLNSATAQINQRTGVNLVEQGKGNSWKDYLTFKKRTPAPAPVRPEDVGNAKPIRPVNKYEQGGTGSAGANTESSGEGGGGFFSGWGWPHYAGAAAVAGGVGYGAYKLMGGGQPQQPQQQYPQQPMYYR